MSEITAKDYGLGGFEGYKLIETTREFMPFVGLSGKDFEWLTFKNEEGNILSLLAPRLEKPMNLFDQTITK